MITLTIYMDPINGCEVFERASNENFDTRITKIDSHKIFEFIKNYAFTIQEPPEVYFVGPESFIEPFIKKGRTFDFMKII